MSILVTGAAGFIGFHLCRKLIQSSINVIGIDNINDYYDISLKEKRLEILNNLAILFDFSASFNQRSS